MKKHIYLLLALLLPLSARAQWRSLLDKDLSQWRIYQSYTFDDAAKAARDKAEAEGHPVRQIGYDVNEGDAFTVEMDGDNPVLHIDGPIYGCVITKEEFGNYHLKLKVKFGEKNMHRASTRHGTPASCTTPRANAALTPSTPGPLATNTKSWKVERKRAVTATISASRTPIWTSVPTW